jgi:hypothetical protein
VHTDTWHEQATIRICHKGRCVTKLASEWIKLHDLAAPQAPVTRADCDGTNALLRHAQSLTAPAPQDQSAPTPAPISSSIGDHGAQATADPGADPNAEWNAACEACAKAIDDESVLSGFWAADLCRDLKRNGEKETT